MIVTVHVPIRVEIEDVVRLASGLHVTKRVAEHVTEQVTAGRKVRAIKNLRDYASVLKGESEPAGLLLHWIIEASPDNTGGSLSQMVEPLIDDPWCRR